MNPLFHHVARLACAALCTCMAFGAASAAAQGRMVSSTWLPGGKFALVCDYEGVEYLTLGADPPDACANVAPASQAIGAAPQPAVVMSRAEAFPESHSYVGGFFIDPLSAALRATGLGLLLGGDWSRGPRHYNR
jgi:hypothetical protein